MSAKDSLALLRIEHKLDLILHALQFQGMALSDLPQLKDYGTDICPVCKDPVRITINIHAETYERACGCRPPVRLVPGVADINQPGPKESPNDSNPSSQAGPSGSG